MNIRELLRLSSWTRMKKNVINRLMKLDTALHSEGAKAAYGP